MAELIYRHQQILIILRDHPLGLTNRQILDIALNMRGNELPNDGTQMALNTLSLRRRELLETTDTPAGKIHQITQKGIDVLADAIGEFGKDQNSNQADQSSAIAQLSALDEVDAALCLIRKCIVDAMNYAADPIKISGKAKKIELLERMENIQLFKSDDIKTLTAIRIDLEQLESE